MPTIRLILIIFVSAALGGALVQWTVKSPDLTDQNEASEPLYWVAPMDPNFRRDKPGKSPMGMDLIPVYAEDGNPDGDGAGTITIAPHVINNMGVRVAPVQSKHIDSDVTTVGYVQYNEDNLVHIHPRVDGWIEQLFVTAAGNPVTEGQPLYSLYSPQLVNAQEEFLIALRRDNQALIQAARERLEALQLSSRVIRELENKRKVQQTVMFYSPQSGVVDGLKVREGFYVQPGTTLMSIAQLDDVWVEAEVFERDSASIQQGLAVSMSLEYLPGRTWEGVVDYVYPSLNPQTRTVRLRMKFENAEQLLKPNMFATVNINTEQTQADITVPKTALIRTGRQDRVVVSLGEGQYKSVAVQVGKIGRDNVEILAGLSSDDSVVVSAQFLIDSESSKTSDFMRMSPTDLPSSVWIKATINRVFPETREVSVNHDAVEQWQWPEMTMNFYVANSVDFDQLKGGQLLHIEVTKNNSADVQITGTHIMGDADFPTATVDGWVEAIDAEQRVLQLMRDAIPKWQRPAASMAFMLDEHVEIGDLTVGDSVSFTFQVRDDLYITDLSRHNANEQVNDND